VFPQVEQRRKEALSRTSENTLSALENTLYDVVSRYSYMDLWPCSSKELDYLARQEVCTVLIFHDLYINASV
jgi:cleavage stimulation factor subunit 3